MTRFWTCFKAASVGAQRRKGYESVPLRLANDDDILELSIPSIVSVRFLLVKQREHEPCQLQLDDTSAASLSMSTFTLCNLSQITYADPFLIT
jgi:hypothetical protein